jgi:hypothetical protein
VANQTSPWGVDRQVANMIVKQPASAPDGTSRRRRDSALRRYGCQPKTFRSCSHTSKVVEGRPIRPGKEFHASLDRRQPTPCGAANREGLPCHSRRADVDRRPRTGPSWTSAKCHCVHCRETDRSPLRPPIRPMFCRGAMCISVPPAVQAASCCGFSAGRGDLAGGAGVSISQHRR